MRALTENTGGATRRTASTAAAMIVTPMYKNSPTNASFKYSPDSAAPTMVRVPTEDSRSGDANSLASSKQASIR